MPSNRIDEYLRCYCNSGQIGNSNKNHLPQQSIRYKYFCETVLLSGANHLRVKLSRIASRCVKNDRLRVFVNVNFCFEIDQKNANISENKTIENFSYKYEFRNYNVNKVSDGLFN